MGKSQANVDDRALGAYGLRVAGLDDAAHLLGPVDPSWPSVEVVVKRGRAAEREVYVDESGAAVVFQNGGGLVVDRRSARAIFTLPYEPTPEELVHPYLAPAAAVMSRWHGRETFHAGAFLLDSGVWGVLADREGGKSSTLARLAMEGVAIVCDDILVVDSEATFSGPRAIDLREEAAHALDLGEAVGVLGARERWRIVLGRIGATPPLRGWIFLSWGDGVALEPVSAGTRLRRLAEHRAVSLPPSDPGLFLRLAARPAFELRRPHQWSSLEQAVQLLLASLP